MTFLIIYASCVAFNLVFLLSITALVPDRNPEVDKNLLSGGLFWSFLGPFFTLAIVYAVAAGFVLAIRKIMR